MKGVIKKLDTTRGFGFIKAANGEEVFFHHSAVRGARFEDLDEGEAVTFDPGEGPKGPRAENVTLA